jgi:hypothetical protein
MCFETESHGEIVEDMMAIVVRRGKKNAERRIMPTSWRVGCEVGESEAIAAMGERE